MSVGLRAVNMPANLASSVATAQGLTNGLLNGSLDAVEVGKFDSVAYAAAMNKMTDDLLKNNPQALAKIKKAKEDISKLNGNLDRGLSSISGGKLNANSLPMGGMDNIDLGNSKLASLGKMPSDSLPKSATGTTYEGSAGAATSKPADLGVSDNFDLGSTSNPTAVIEATPKFDDEKFELKVFDINDNPEENLFDIVSHRYQKTGMRLLFENPTPEGVPVESAPAATSEPAAP